MDMNNDYTHAGPGFKRRERRERLAPTAKTKTKPYLQSPTSENRKVISERMSDAYNNARGIKARIRLLVIDHDMSYLDCVQTMKEQGYSVSGVTISAIRTEIREVMKLFEDEGLLNIEALAQRRRRIKKKLTRARSE